MVTTVTSSTSSATQDLSSYYQEKIENFQNGKTQFGKKAVEVLLLFMMIFLN